MGVARKFQSRCLLLPHPSAPPLPDLFIDIFDLHWHKIPHPDLRLVPLCLVFILCNCAKWVSSWLAWGRGGE